MIRALKAFYRFLFKWPARKYLGFYTVFIDLKAILFRLFSKPVTETSLKKITICVGVKNRSHSLLTQLVSSLNQVAYKEMIELSVVDCKSDDHTDLISAIKTIWKGALIYQTSDMAFARSKVFNQAVKQASNNLIFICDADISLPPNLVVSINQHCQSYQAWAPEVLLMTEQGLPDRFCSEGVGMLACFKHQFEAIGGFDERFLEWGKEDWLLFFECYKQGIAVYRTKEALMQHAYHESLKPKDFKPLF